MSKLLLLVCLTSTAFAVEFQLKNNLGGPMWVGILGNNGKRAPENGGVALNQGEMKSVHTEENWAGRFWARTWCNGDTNHCETGDCGNKFQCNGAGGVPPVTLAEITLKGDAGNDFYDISLVDGFNVPVTMEPLGGSGDCKTVGCNTDLNPGCPNDLKVIGSAGYAIACNSACNKYNRDQDCCRGAFDRPQTCPPPNSATYFKQNCRDAYSYAYDDATSTFTCKAPAYRITFGQL